LSTTETLSQIHYIWKDRKIGAPPQRAEFPLGYTEIRKALLSFKFDMSNGLGTRIDPDQAIVINDKKVQNLDLPQSKKSLEVVERTDIDVTKMLKTGPTGVKNLVEVNYLLSAPAIMKTRVPGATIGSLTLYFTIWYPGIKIIKDEGRPSKFCMNCGESIPFDSRFCPKCGLPPPAGGAEGKQCRNNDCRALLPPTAKFCEKCGSEQPKAGEALMTCWNCKSVLAANSAFCSVCGKSQKQDRPESSLTGQEGVAEVRLCWNCKNELSATARFCERCGKDQQQQQQPPEGEKSVSARQCWNCSSALLPNAKFCSVCGKPQ
jgi:predicted amidophosphoribosyltransferase